ncbi:hypothetical protein HAX54_035277 [Datura stramonium]|uniref:Uncharacterized protein n=1 Tax=Datura stramonium TaxID=4076 RepID=A0ABS8RP47_DATST|nr:hypothetical protein [Datura stramonium]
MSSCMEIVPLKLCLVIDGSDELSEFSIGDQIPRPAGIHSWSLYSRTKCVQNQFQLDFISQSALVLGIPFLDAADGSVFKLQLGTLAYFESPVHWKREVFVESSKYFYFLVVHFLGSLSPLLMGSNSEFNFQEVFLELGIYSTFLLSVYCAGSLLLHLTVASDTFPCSYSLECVGMSHM